MKENTPELRIKGKKVFLRPPTESDLAEFTNLNRRSRKLHRGLTASPQTKEEFERHLERNQKPSDACFLICLSGDGAIAGAINISQIIHGSFKSAYIGYYLGAGFTGKGYMTEAVELILRYAFRTLKLHRIEANVQPQNKPSIAVLERNGFTKEGYSPKYLKVLGKWRDHERWAIIVENWKRERKPR